MILAFDVVDLGGMFKNHMGDGAPDAKIIHVSMDHRIHNGWSMDHQGLPPVDMFLSADAGEVVSALVAALVDGKAPALPARKHEPIAIRANSERPLVRDLALSLNKALGDRDTCLMSTTIAWH